MQDGLVQVLSLHLDRCFRLLLKAAGFQENVETCEHPLWCCTAQESCTVFSVFSKDLSQKGNSWELPIQTEFSAFAVISPGNIK